jgi:1,4-dihydroxy-6-naphthoate synthase
MRPFMKIAISPCPNDTFLFHAWIAGHVGGDVPLDPHFADIQQLNLWAEKETFPLVKLSFPCFLKIASNYQLLPIGAALGFHCGPKIVAKHPFSLSEFSQKKVAIPGVGTTAHFLMQQLLSAPKEKVFCLYHEIPRFIEEGHADCGLIIHESRFTFQEAGLVEIVDLGEIWHDHMGMPLPLGGLAIARKLPSTAKNQVLAILKASLAYARNQPEQSATFILEHSQEKDSAIVNEHIKLYVNSETEQLSPKGIRAIETLLGGKLPKDWLYMKNDA